QPGALVADVTGVVAAVRRRDLGEGDQLVRLGVGAGVVDQAGGEAVGTVLHALVDDAFHFGEFSGRRGAVDVAHDFLADVVVRHLVDDVAADAVLFERREECGDVGRPGAAVAGDGRGQTLEGVGQVRPRPRILERVVAVRVQVDEPGR